MDLAGIINRANQLNPNNWRYWKSRSFSSRPQDWAVLVGKTQLPAVTWLETLSNIQSLKSLGKASAKVLAVCGHGIAKGFCYLCTLKGAIIFVSATSIALVYWYYPKQSKDYALKGLNATGSLYRSSASFVGKNAIMLGEYWKHFRTVHIWHYGVIIPFRAVQSGVVSSSESMKNLAVQIGYYCGSKTPEKPYK